MGAAGFEQPRESPRNTHDSQTGGSKSGNIGAECGPATPPTTTPATPPATPATPATPTPPVDPELAAVVEAWATLAPAIRAGIVAMVASVARVGH
jgi:hypothetical protein